MNFFTDELKKITDRSEYIHNPKFVGKSCVFRLSDDVTGKLEFVTGIVANHYNSLRLKLFNQSEGPIDTQLMGIGDIIGNKKIYSNIQSPYIWKVEITLTGTDISLLTAIILPCRKQLTITCPVSQNRSSQSPKTKN